VIKKAIKTKNNFENNHLNINHIMNELILSASLNAASEAVETETTQNNGVSPKDLIRSRRNISKMLLIGLLSVIGITTVLAQLNQKRVIIERNVEGRTFYELYRFYAGSFNLEAALLIGQLYIDGSVTYLKWYDVRPPKAIQIKACNACTPVNGTLTATQKTGQDFEGKKGPIIKNSGKYVIFTTKAYITSFYNDGYIRLKFGEDDYDTYRYSHALDDF
jgi:hypothetical protein